MLIIYFFYETGIIALSLDLNRYRLISFFLRASDDKENFLFLRSFYLKLIPYQIISFFQFCFFMLLILFLDVGFKFLVVLSKQSNCRLIFLL